MAVILVGCLAEFTAEVPPPGPVRLSLTCGLTTSRLDLQARTPAGLIWLADWYTKAAPAGVHTQLPQARAAVERWLAGRGYEVRPGRWATPPALRPARGRFECLAWLCSHPSGCAEGREPVEGQGVGDGWTLVVSPGVCGQT